MSIVNFSFMFCEWWQLRKILIAVDVYIRRYCGKIAKSRGVGGT